MPGQCANTDNPGTECRTRSWKRTGTQASYEGYTREETRTHLPFYTDLAASACIQSYWNKMAGYAYQDTASLEDTDQQQNTGRWAAWGPFQTDTPASKSRQTRT